MSRPWTLYSSVVIYAIVILICSVYCVLYFVPLYFHKDDQRHRHCKLSGTMLLTWLLVRPRLFQLWGGYLVLSAIYLGAIYPDFPYVEEIIVYTFARFVYQSCFTMYSLITVMGILRRTFLRINFEMNGDHMVFRKLAAKRNVPMRQIPVVLFPASVISFILFFLHDGRWSLWALYYTIVLQMSMTRTGKEVFGVIFNIQSWRNSGASQQTYFFRWYIGFLDFLLYIFFLLLIMCTFQCDLYYQFIASSTDDLALVMNRFAVGGVTYPWNPSRRIS